MEVHLTRAVLIAQAPGGLLHRQRQVGDGIVDSRLVRLDPLLTFSVFALQGLERPAPLGAFLQHLVDLLFDQRDFPGDDGLFVGEPLHGFGDLLQRSVGLDLAGIRLEDRGAKVLLDAIEVGDLRFRTVELIWASMSRSSLFREIRPAREADGPRLTAPLGSMTSPFRVTNRWPVTSSAARAKAASMFSTTIVLPKRYSAK